MPSYPPQWGPVTSGITVVLVLPFGAPRIMGTYTLCSDVPLGDRMRGWRRDLSARTVHKLAVINSAVVSPSHNDRKDPLKEELGRSGALTQSPTSFVGETGPHKASLSRFTIKDRQLMRKKHDGPLRHCRSQSP